MSEYDWDFDHHPVRGTDVRRRLILDQRSYDVTAFDDGTGTVGLRVVGWDCGYVFAEFAAELPAGDATDVGQLIASALAGFRGGGPPPPGPPVTAATWPKEPRPTAPKSGQPWEPADLDLLVRRFQEGASIEALTVELGRTDGAVRQRLQLLGETRLTTSDETPPQPPGEARSPAEALPPAETRPPGEALPSSGEALPLG